MISRSGLRTRIILRALRQIPHSHITYIPKGMTLRTGTYRLELLSMLYQTSLFLRPATRIRSRSYWAAVLLCKLQQLHPHCDRTEMEKFMPLISSWRLRPWIIAVTVWFFDTVWDLLLIKCESDGISGKHRWQTHCLVAWMCISYIRSIANVGTKSFRTQQE